MSQILLMSQKLEPLPLKNQKLFQKEETKRAKLKTTIKIAITPLKILTGVACKAETHPIALALQNLIVYQIDKCATRVLVATVCHTISANATLH